MALLEVHDLSVRYATRRGPAHALEQACFRLEAGQVLGVVGESGCGKTTMGLALMGLLPDAADVSGKVLLDNRDISGLTPEAWGDIRGRDVAMIFQGAMNAWNPVYPVGEQIIEAILAHEPAIGRRAADQRVIELFAAVGLDADARRNFPHEYSGGMKQRAVIAMALACGPRVLIADEPTTALDVIVQHQILKELRRARAGRDLGMVYITHDMAVVAGLADVVAVMYAGRIVETGPVDAIFTAPSHPYTAALLSASPAMTGPRHVVHGLPGGPPSLVSPPPGCRFAPRCSLATGQCTEEPPAARRDGLVAHCWFPLGVGDSPRAASAETIAAASTGGDDAARIRIESVSRVFVTGPRFPRKARRALTAVGDVSLNIAAGEVLGLVGGSGSGKTTLGRMLVGLTDPTAGLIRIEVDGATRDLAELDRRTLRRNVQMIFQDPYESLNPRMRIGDIVAEPLEVLGIDTGGDRRSAVADMLERTGLTPAHRFARRYPHELSGGQRQRVAIARAMVVSPQIIVADEPTSMLDVSVRAGIMDVLLELRRDLNLSMLYITHDLAVARYLCDRTAVMYRGRIIELGDTEDVLAKPLHPYTRALLAAVPLPEPGRDRAEPEILAGSGEDADARCRFLAQCPIAEDRCRAAQHPPLNGPSPQHSAACYVTAG